MVRLEDDFPRWTQEQARAPRARDPEGLDWEALAEEVERMGRKERHRALLDDSPSLRHHLDAVFVQAREQANDLAERDTGLPGAAFMAEAVTLDDVLPPAD